MSHVNGQQYDCDYYTSASESTVSHDFPTSASLTEHSKNGKAKKETAGCFSASSILRPNSSVPSEEVCPVLTETPYTHQEDYTGILVRHGKRFDVCLSMESMTWERRGARKTCSVRSGRKFRISLENIVGASSKVNLNLKNLLRKKSSLFKLRVYTYKTLEDHSWKLCYYEFSSSNLLESQQWAKHINHRLSFLKRPRECHVFVNPFSGQGTACKLYNTKIAPIFQLAGITATVTVTERAGHAKDLISTMDLSSGVTLVCVGGDGLFHEAINGLFWRQQKEQFGAEAGKCDPVPCSTRLGIIPAGSTNGIVYCATGVIDHVTSALHIALGREAKFDLATCRHNDRIERFATNFIGHGFLGDVLKLSENYRWMGPSRYDFSGILTYFNMGVYPGTLEYLEANTAGQPRDSNRCQKNCGICGEDVQPGEEKWASTNDEFVAIEGCIQSCKNPHSKNGVSPSAHLGDGCLDLIVCKRTSRLRHFRYLASHAWLRKPFTGDHVEVHRVREFKFTAGCPDPDQHHRLVESDRCPSCSFWNVDGEIYDKRHIHVKVHRQIGVLLASQPLL